MNNSIVSKQTQYLATQTELILAFGKLNHWKFNHLGNAPVPTKVVKLENWMVVPAQEDTSAIPPRAMERVQTMYQAGIRPQAWVVVHEAPMILPATNDPEKSQPQSPVLPYLLALGGLGIWLASTLITTVAVVDPILIAITDDLDWIEIDRWVN